MNSRAFQFKPDLATLVAEMAIRSAIRPFLSSPSLRFAVVILLPDRRDLFVYMLVARRMLEGDDPYDELGNRDVFVDVVLDRSKTDWAMTLRHIRKAVFFATSEADVCTELRLAVDHFATLRLPTGVHFKAAALKLGLVMNKSQADILAGRSLEELRVGVRQGRPVSRVLRQLSACPKSVADTPPTVGTNAKGPRLEDLSGYGEAKTWGLRLAGELDAWKRGCLDWSDIDRGVLLCGPPGSGKTTYAAALAKSCDVPLFSSSAAQWQAMGHLGDMLKAMRKTFADAAARRPCIIFIDEFDSVGNRLVGKDHEYYDYKRRVINALLECLDPPGGREGVVVVGATNDAQHIDPALLRPGRLDRVIDIPLPDGEARQAILRHYLPSAAVNDLSDFIRVSEGWSGADIEKVARDARRLARDDGRREVQAGDLSLALPSQIEFTQEERARLAVHEAGHAIAALTLRPDTLVRVSITKWRVAAASRKNIGATELRNSIPSMATSDQYADLIVVYLAGVAAETLVLGSHSSAAGGDDNADLAMATDVATLMERSFGFGGSWLTDRGSGARPLEYLRLADPELRVAVRARLDASYARAYDILRQRLSSLKELAEVLGERLEVDADEVRAICSQEKDFP